jgi:hypothetical protein
MWDSWQTWGVIVCLASQAVPSDEQPHGKFEMLNEKVLLVALGIASILSAVILFRKTRAFLESASVTTGEVVGYGVADGSTAGSKSTTAIIRYSVDGRVYRCTEFVGSKGRNFVGKKVRLWYDRKQPSHARMTSLWRLYFFETIFVVVGVSALLAAYWRG